MNKVSWASTLAVIIGNLLGHLSIITLSTRVLPTAKLACLCTSLLLSLLQEKRSLLSAHYLLYGFSSAVAACALAAVVLGKCYRHCHSYVYKNRFIFYFTFIVLAIETMKCQHKIWTLLFIAHFLSQEINCSLRIKWEKSSLEISLNRKIFHMNSKKKKKIFFSLALF